MVRVTVGEREYRIPDRWSEITLRTYIQLTQITVPERLVALVKTAATIPTARRTTKDYEAAAAAITLDDIVDVFPRYYGEVIVCLCPPMADVIDRLRHEQRAALYDNHLRHFTLSYIMAQPLDLLAGETVAYTPPAIKTFEAEGETYQFPTSIKMLDAALPLASEQIIGFAEASGQLRSAYGLSEQGEAGLAMFMAVYCRRPREQYDEGLVLKRAERMKSVNMEVVWALFFCITRLLTEYTQITASYLKGAQAAILRKVTSEVTDNAP